MRSWKQVSHAHPAEDEISVTDLLPAVMNAGHHGRHHIDHNQIAIKTTAPNMPGMGFPVVGKITPHRTIKRKSGILITRKHRMAKIIRFGRNHRRMIRTIPFSHMKMIL